MSVINNLRLILISFFIIIISIFLYINVDEQKTLEHSVGSDSKNVFDRIRLHEIDSGAHSKVYMYTGNAEVDAESVKIDDELTLSIRENRACDFSGIKNIVSVDLRFDDLRRIRELLYRPGSFEYWDSSLGSTQWDTYVILDVLNSNKRSLYVFTHAGGCKMEAKEMGVYEFIKSKVGDHLVENILIIAGLDIQSIKKKRV